ncbi:t-SNARE [Pavlovales sp. CCMP2436]|nr:t-SNARE [Pavlovales sp. CCMP2436]
MPALVDRTAEFRALAGGLARTLPARPAALGPPRVRTRSDFTQLTAQVGSQIFATTQKLDKLSQLAQSRSLFDDPTVEINELTIIIKQSLSSLNAQLREVQLTGGNGRQAASHTTHVVDALQLQLSTAAKGFQDVLQMRSNNIRVQMDRQKQFEGPAGSRGPAAPMGLAMGGGGSAGPGARPGAGSHPLFTPPRPTAYDESADHGVADFQVQMAHLMPSSYLESRALAVESVQSTIVELGSIFQQLQSVVAEQHEMVDRIDVQVEETVNTVDATRAQLTRMYQNMSHNRLAMKCALLLLYS